MASGTIQGNKIDKVLIDWSTASMVLTTSDKISKYKYLLFSLNGGGLISTILVPTDLFKSDTTTRYVVRNGVAATYDSNAACAFVYKTDTSIEVINYSGTQTYQIRGLN